MKKVLIVVDYQNDFVSGSLGFPRAKELEPFICEKIKKYYEAGDTVIFTKDTHGPDFLQTREGKYLSTVHCQKNSNGWKFYGKVAELCKDESKVFEKDTFGSWKLAEYLRANPFDKVEVAGVVTSICVLSNTILAQTAMPNAEIVIDANCVACPEEKMQEKTFDILRNLHVTILNQ